jgi:Ser/Thr protein kinase RdoA (MazF antagonist)
MRDTIEMAQEAGIIDFRDALSEAHVQDVLENLKSFEALVRADEREACAKVCENWTQTPETTGMELALCAIALRARGQA